MTELIWNNLFLLMAIFTSSLAAVSSGIIGTYVVIKRISYLAGSLSHAVMGGMGIFLFLQRSYGLEFLTPNLGALFTAIVSALILAYGRYKFREREDTLISIIWSLGMSVGIIFLAMTPGTNVDVLNFLFGNLLWSGPNEIIYLTGLLGFVLYFHKKHFHNLVALSFDEKQATLSGIDCKKLFIKLLCLTGIVIIFLIKTVGAILVMSMLTIPAATACYYAKTVKEIVRLSVILGVCYAIIGVLLAYMLNWPPGASITLVASIGYMGAKMGAFKSL